MTAPTMESLRLLLLFVHFLGMASLIGGFLIQIRGPERRIIPAIVYGALIELVTGPLLIGTDHVLDKAVNGPKMGVKLLVLVVITVLALIYRKRPTPDRGGAEDGLEPGEDYALRVIAPTR